MARTFRRSRPSHPISELNLTNLIDLGFVLLIIFMISTPLINQEQTIPVNLPVESASTQVKVDKNTVFKTITIQASGAYSLENRTVTFAQLTRELAGFANDPKPPVIRIRMDAKSTAQQFVSLMDELKKQNLTKFTFDTQTGG